jgi:hypothetical protein
VISSPAATAFLNMRLYFSENCPDDYQPQGFVVCC